MSFRNHKSVNYRTVANVTKYELPNNITRIKFISDGSDWHISVKMRNTITMLTESDGWVTEGVDRLMSDSRGQKS